MKGPNDCDINLVVLLHTVLFLCAQLVQRHSYLFSLCNFQESEEVKKEFEGKLSYFSLDGPPS